LAGERQDKRTEGKDGRIVNPDGFGLVRPDWSGLAIGIFAICLVMPGYYEFWV